MTGPDGPEALAAILDALTLIQDQLEELGDRAKRLEANQGAIIARLDVADATQVSLTNLQPSVERILDEMADSRAMTRSGLERVAEVAGLAHAAAIGNHAPLPADVLDDPLLERYVISQPADLSSTRRALIDWRRISSRLDTSALVQFLRRQYQPSPMDEARDRTLRYQLAAVTRAELERRGVEPPTPPTTTIAGDRSPAARRARSSELVRIWRAGEGAALCAEPELAGALDILAAARAEGKQMPEADLQAGLSELRETIANRLSAGDRPILATADRRTFSPDLKQDR